MDVKITKTAFEMAEPVGRKLVQQAREDRDYRKSWTHKEIGQASKEAAQYLGGQARGRISVMIDADSWTRIFRRKRDKKYN